MNTSELIASLSADRARPILGKPVYYGVRLLAVLLVYALGIQAYLGIRSDLFFQFTRPFFIVEIGLLALLIGSSAWASILSMYPDLHQRRWPLNLPFFIFGILLVFVMGQLLFWLDPKAGMSAMGPIDAHGIECVLCIAGVSIVPSALIFALLRKGASIHPLRSGSFAVLAATGIGCLTLRLAELHDSMVHIAQWHYLPTLLFAGFGAWIGRKLLKW